MGLMIHSLGEVPPTVERGYFIYLLDYGWTEPLGEVVDRNFAHMARQASERNAVVIRGVVGSHFVSEVLSWHHVNGQPAEELLPAIMVTRQNPNDFRLAQDNLDKPMLLIPIKKFCKSTQEVINLIDRLFKDIETKKELSEFAISSQLKQGKRGALVDALILEPNIAGVGLDVKKAFSFLGGVVKKVVNK